MSLHHRWMILEPAAAIGLYLFQLIQRVEHPIGQWFVGKRPEPFSGLYLGRVCREEVQAWHSCATPPHPTAAQSVCSLPLRLLRQRAPGLEKTPRHSRLARATTWYARFQDGQRHTHTSTATAEPLAL